MSEKQFYSKEYWYDSPEEHSDVDNYGKNYYGYQILEKVVLQLQDIPKDGYIVLLGTNRCVALDLLCDHFGRDRCIGYDLHNPIGHECVIEKDCMELSKADDIPIAFCHNDLGSFPKTPELKIYGQKWAAKNIIKGGYFLGRNNLNSAKFKSEELMHDMGFENLHFKDIQDQYDMKNFDPSWIEGHMLSRKK
mgnify:FL=1|jgi:hypothetical protein|tara:strand:- start:1295 stop:1870 length:576 start_codon:yes stop_codon:yes gene_type:complete